MNVFNRELMCCQRSILKKGLESKRENTKKNPLKSVVFSDRLKKVSLFLLNFFPFKFEYSLRSLSRRPWQCNVTNSEELIRPSVTDCCWFGSLQVVALGTNYHPPRLQVQPECWNLSLTTEEGISIFEMKCLRCGLLAGVIFANEAQQLSINYGP